MADIASQSYRETSLFISRGLAGPEAAKPAGEDPRGTPGEELPIETAAGKMPAAPDRCSEEDISEASVESVRAVALGRLARCLERAGQLDAAEEMRQEQAALHRRFGSILFPADYYRQGGEQGKLLEIGAGDPVTDCVKAIEDASDTADCPHCQRPVVLANTCNLSVELAYCSRAPSQEGPISNCVQYRSLDPGEAIVILAPPDVVANPIVSFRSADEREHWVRTVDRTQ